MAKPAPARRIGAEDSETRARLLDAAEALLVAEGYASVTSRRVAARAELKPQLVHYYFRTMDDLFLAVFRRRAEENIVHFEQAITADPSLRTLWNLSSDARGAAFTLEFVALANHRTAVRAEVAAYAERFRALQVEAVGAALTQHGLASDELPPTVALLLMTGLAQVMGLEERLGVTSGHEATREFVEQMIERFEGPSTGSLR